MDSKIFDSSNVTARTAGATNSVASRIVDAWTRDYLAKPWAVYLLGVAFSAYLILLALVGPVPSTTASHDVFLGIDGGWRVLHGLVPYRDFYLSLGPLTYIFTAAGLWLAHNDAQGFTLGLLLFAAIITATAFAVSRTRMTAAGVILFSTFILLLCTSPTPLGQNPSAILTNAMAYNRFGYSLLGIILVAQFLRPNSATGGAGDDRFGDAVSGAILITLFFLKLSYFGVGAVLLLLATIEDWKNAKRVMWLFAGAGPMLAVMLTSIRFHVLALIRDTVDTIQNRSSKISHFGIGDILGLSTVTFIAFLVSACFSGEKNAAGRSRAWLLTAGACTILGEAIFNRTNGGQGDTYPLYVVFILLILTDFSQLLNRNGGLSPQYSATILVIGLALTVPMFYVHFRSLALLANYKTSSRLKAAAYRIQGQHLKALAFYDTQGEPEASTLENGHYFVAYMDDGINLLKLHSSQSDLVTTIGYDNPFPYALLRTPPTGGSPWWQVGYNISLDHLPAASRMFGNAAIIMVPKYPSSHLQTDQLLFQAYEPYLLDNFSLVAESKWWRMYRRSKSSE